MRRHAAALAGIVSSALSLTPTPGQGLTATPTVPHPTPTCRQLTAADVVFNSIRVDPENPIVGDVVYVDTSVGVMPPGSRAGHYDFTIEGAAPTFEPAYPSGSSPGPGSTSARLELRAVQAGQANLRLGVTYETAYGCESKPYYQFVTKRSDFFVVGVTEGTPHPTRTPTPTVTATSSRTATASQTPETPGPPSPTPNCVEVRPASLVFTHIDVEPQQPVVGDTMYIDFGVCLLDGPGGVFFYRLDGTTPLLEGITERSGNGIFGIRCDEGRFEMNAVAAGTASVTIQASYETAMGCVGQLVYFFLYAPSDPFVIEIGTGTPQPTRTPTSTATATQSRTPTPPTSTPTVSSVAPCHGDCGGDHVVTIDEIVSLVDIALGTSSADNCPHADSNSTVTVDEILLAIQAAIDGCSML